MWWGSRWTKGKYFIVKYTARRNKGKIKYWYLIRGRNAFSRKCKLIFRRIITTLILTFVTIRRRTIRNSIINVTICDDDAIINLNVIISCITIISYVIISFDATICFHVIISLNSIITTYGGIDNHVRIRNAYRFHFYVINYCFSWKLTSRVLSISYYSHYSKGLSRNRCYPN